MIINYLQNKPLIFTLDNVLTDDFCQTLIKQSESHGFEQAQIHLSNGQSQTHLTIRNNDRIEFINNVLAQQLFTFICSYLPNEWLDDDSKKWQLLGVNENFRYYRYQVGQRFKAHLDGFYEKGNCKSFLTVLFYLNDDYQGGETKFFAKDNGRLNTKSPTFIINPKKGGALIFYHAQFHEGASVTQGVKYALRTDVIYQQL